jgi:hypothetical protein
MMTRFQLACLMLTLGLLAATVAPAEDTVPLRSFSRFELDSGTVEGLWTEVGNAYSEDRQSGVETDLNTTFGRFAYGDKYSEAGLLFPYHNLDVDLGRSGSANEDGTGDLRLYGKTVPIRTELIDLGAGMELSVPTGEEDEGLGEGEVGFLPFVTSAVHLGMVDARGHFGYRFFSDDDKWEAFHYGFGLYAPIGKNIALRTEFNAIVQKAPGSDPDPWMFEPGVDIGIPAGEGIEFVVRPTGLVGMNNDAPDWGVGGSVVLAWSPR